MLIDVNGMFLGSGRGAQSSAVIYSIVQTAKENGLIPQRYLKYLLEELSKIEISGKNQIENLDRFVNGLKIAHYKTPPEHAIIIPHTGGVIHDTKATARLGQSC